MTNEPDPATAHSADCWRAHHDCAVCEVERLRQELVNCQYQVKDYQQNLVLLSSLLDKMVAEVNDD